MPGFSPTCKGSCSSLKVGKVVGTYHYDRKTRNLNRKKRQPIQGQKFYETNLGVIFFTNKHFITDWYVHMGSSLTNESVDQFFSITIMFEANHEIDEVT